ncbi:transporter [Hymenobacter terricola]|uniref:transporter n=1 Tax=Hymenobacter terricola TaxID=2819236 RepID=UPI001B300FC4|nr:transporter [Hymenobacter terricola]
MFRLCTFCLLLLGYIPAAFAQPGVKNDTIKVDKTQYNLFRPTPRKYMRPMVPDRPGITESPYSVDAGHFQYETDALRLLTRREGTTYGHDWYVNHALAKIGLSDRTDLQVGVDSYTATRNYDEADASQTQEYHGLGDVTLRLKHTLVGDDNSRWALGLIGYATLPTGGPRGDGAVEYGAVLPVVYQITKPWSIGGQVAAQVYWDRDTQARFLQLTPTFTTDYQFTKIIQAFVELVGYDEVRLNDWRSSINTGAQLDVSENVQLDFGTHLPITHSTDREYFFGLSFRR